MKIGKYEITGGPNWQFYAATAFFIYLSITGETIWPVLCWILFCIAMVPLCIFLHKWDKKEDEKMVRDFPLDPYIQKKYGKKT
jgi:hypothetical protein